MLWIAAAFALGIAVGGWVLTAAPAAWLVRNRAVRWNILLLVVAVLFGAARTAVDRIVPADGIVHWISDRPRPIVLRGLLLGQPEFTGQGKMAHGWLRVESIRVGEQWVPCSGKLQVRLPAEAGLLLAGEHLQLYGLLRSARPKVSGRFDEEQWLRLRGAAGVLAVSDAEGVIRLSAAAGVGFRYRRWVERFRRHLQGIGRSLLDPGEAGFLEALLLGQSRGISRSDWEAFRKTGTVHVLVVSGLHVGLIGGICLLLLIALRLPRSVCYGFLSVILISYCLLTGLNPPIVRATVAGVLLCWAKVRGVEHSALNLIGAAAFGMLFLDPKMLLDASFQLSFAATAAVVAADGWMAGTLQPFRSRFLVRAGAVSLSAWAATLPILACRFQSIALLAPAANLLVVPLTSLLTAVGFLVYGIGWLAPPAAVPFAAVFAWGSRGLTRLVQAAGTLPGCYWSW